MCVRIIFYTMKKNYLNLIAFTYICVNKLRSTMKLRVGKFSFTLVSFTREKKPQINFSLQNFSVENSIKIVDWSLSRSETTEKYVRYYQLFNSV